MGIFDKADDYIELEPEEERRAKVPIEVERLSEYADSDRIQRKLREGAIMLIRVKELREKNIAELKRALERIKRTCEAVGGDIVGAGEDWIIASSSHGKIVR
ncbi:MAG: cell division protein SepF [Candidatus Aenigmatarchaeota archaeon]